MTPEEVRRAAREMMGSPERYKHELGMLATTCSLWADALKSSVPTPKPRKRLWLWAIPWLLAAIPVCAFAGGAVLWYVLYEAACYCEDRIRGR